MAAVSEGPTVVRDILQGSTFGAEEIHRLERMLIDRASELRQELNDVEEEGVKHKTLKMGIGLFLGGLHQQAEPYLAKAATTEGIAAFYHGQNLIYLNRFADAAAAFEKSASMGTEPVLSMLWRAGAVRCLGDYDQADKLLKQASQQGGSTKAEYCFQMGCLLADRGDTFGAIEYFERAVDMDPTHSRALFWLAGENALRGNDDEAIRRYEQALSRPPLHLGALINLAIIYEDNENYSSARYCLERVLDADPNHARARLYLKDVEAATEMYYDADSLRNAMRLKQILETPVTDFELTVRSRNCLQKMGIKNLGDLTRVSEQELLASRNFGDTSLVEVKEMMQQKGLRLGQAVAKDRSRDYLIPNESLSPQQQALLTRPVADLNLSVRARKCMARLQITMMSELVSRTADELLESKNFGVTSLNEVRSKLSEAGLKLRND